jgi:hypothetical protein
VGGEFPAEVPIRLTPGDAVVEADVTLPFCPDGDGAEAQAGNGTGLEPALCASRTVRLRLPLRVAEEGGGHVLRMDYRFPGAGLPYPDRPALEAGDPGADEPHGAEENSAG